MIVGTAHGILFIGYIGLLYMVWAQRNFSSISALKFTPWISFFSSWTYVCSLR